MTQTLNLNLRKCLRHIQSFQTQKKDLTMTDLGQQARITVMDFLTKTSLVDFLISLVEKGLVIFSKEEVEQVPQRVQIYLSESGLHFQMC